VDIAGDEDYPTKEADLSLIAAAPALYAKLNLALLYLYKMEADGVQTACPVSNVIRATEAVLRAARGENNGTQT
jgi:hypothetical protein